MCFEGHPLDGANGNGSGGIRMLLSCGNGGCELSFSEEEHCWMCLLEQTSVHCGDMSHNTSRNS